VTDGGTALPETHALLRVLAFGRDVLELGTAFGVGAAAMAETARSVTTIELDSARAAAARERTADLPNVSVLEGDWREVAGGTYGLVFADAGQYDFERILELTQPGGFIVKDDLTPARAVDGDPVREFLLGDPRLVATELLLRDDVAAIVAVRVAPSRAATRPA
jgi:predicted O-methyltransferase YrrM